ncbi:hypothetical protein H0H81_009893 [Sphagnurus paluster]|uniref:Isochorismatase-like domain-containing protein n=1 Tax=Sphagnurus paluster TaxID=117069 RepID=A0A9P7KNA1_9AGAR|nr:hypothetical protein H0H81_009893 [Sphagnurus paluster]
MPLPTPANTLFFLCDLQSVFRSSISGFDHLVFTTNKLLRLAKVRSIFFSNTSRLTGLSSPLQIIGCEVVSCTQAARAFTFYLALGPLDPRIDLKALGPLHVGTFDKTSFSMITPEIENLLRARPHVRNIVLFGIEAHICVLQTALGLLHPSASFASAPYKPYVIADCLASHNPWEIPLVVQRLVQEGAVVTSSESMGFQLIGDSRHPNFRAFSALIKDTKEGTERAGEALLGGGCATCKKTSTQQQQEKEAAPAQLPAPIPAVKNSAL